MNADQVYAQSAMNIAIGGKFLFKTVGEATNDTTALKVNLGRGKWFACPQGVSDAQSFIKGKLSNYKGLNRNLPSDFGLICNEEGEVLYRASTNGRIWAVEYIGQSGGEVVNRRITTKEMGVA